MVSSPPFLFPCYYGTDVPDKHMLIANQHTKDEIRDLIGVDSLNYLDLEDMKKIVNIQVHTYVSKKHRDVHTQIWNTQTYNYEDFKSIHTHRA